MKKFLILLFRHWSKTPVKISLTLLSVALGTGIIILSFSTGSILEGEILRQLNDGGSIVYAANGRWNRENEIERQDPVGWDRTIFDRLESDSPDVEAAAMNANVRNWGISRILTNGKSYIVRSAIGTTPGYFDVFSLKMISGFAMTEEDFDMSKKKVWMNEEMAILLYGSAEAAIGQRLNPPGKELEEEGKRRMDLYSFYSVTGVFQTPGETARRAYGIADLVFPISSFISAEVAAAGKAFYFLDYLAGWIVVKNREPSVEKTISRLAVVVKNSFGEETQLTAWEGTPYGTSDYMDGIRRTVSFFTVSLNILGIILLLISSLGIFSIMFVEALSRKREIALERALGASRRRVIMEFWNWSLMLTFLGALLGIILAVLLSRPVLGAMAPLLEELSGNDLISSGIRFSALLNGTALALLCGSVLGLIPSLSAVRGDIADILREE